MTYFPGLHALRFIAAMLVLVSHVELMKSHHGLASLAGHPVIYELGRIAVTFFFVLSGFLITYLLLVERSATGTVAVGKFYVRRIFRIWPLYFLVVILAFFVLPRFEAFRLAEAPAAASAVPLILYALFLPQLALSVFPPVPYAEPLWSIGVEEQFYLLWPVLVGRTKRFVSIAIAIGILCVLARQLPILFAPRLRGVASLEFWNDFIDYFYFTRMECMVVGALSAVAVFRRAKRLLRVVHHPLAQTAAYALSAYLILTPKNKPLLHYGVHAVVFAVIIVNIATNPRSLFRLENRLLVFLGNASYAIYMLHEIVISAVIRALLAVTGSVSSPILYAASIALTIAVASATYWYFERWFLRRKLAFAVVPGAPQLSPA